jgi:hypothetical protein
LLRKQYAAVRFGDQLFQYMLDTTTPTVFQNVFIVTKSTRKYFQHHPPLLRVHTNDTKYYGQSDAAAATQGFHE